MKLTRILQAASAACPQILEVWDEAAERPSLLPPEGNVLAWFMVTKLVATYDALASDKDQLMTASNTLQKAIDALQRTSWQICTVWWDTVSLEPQYLEGLPDLEFRKDPRSQRGGA